MRTKMMIKNNKYNNFYYFLKLILKSFFIYNKMSNSQILNINNWRNEYNLYKKSLKLTQIDYYKKNTSDESIHEIVSMESKRFGSVGEKIISKLFKLGERTSTQNDGTRNGKKIEIKCARYWAGSNDCKWQHLEPDHDYEYVLFSLLDFHGWKVWCINKKILMEECRDKKFLTYQGNQGWWCNKNSILSYLTPINSIEDLDNFLDKN